MEPVNWLLFGIFIVIALWKVIQRARSEAAQKRQEKPRSDNKDGAR